MVEELNPERSTARHPLFQVMIAHSAEPEPTLDLPGLRTGLDTVRPDTAKFDLTFNFRERRADGAGPAASAASWSSAVISSTGRPSRRSSAGSAPS
ncbi:hypothetical protein GTV15_06260, partial [Streptomyces sp. SID7803]|nr:hypothetical protein [Streptomyces sp. SID7803]